MMPRQTLTHLSHDFSLSPSDDEHCACLVALGRQSEGTAFWAGVPLPWGAQYEELMVAVPFVRCDRTGDTCLVILGMTCDAWWAVWSGNAYYGFRKRLTSIRWDDRRFLATGDGERDSLDATVEPRAVDASGQLAWIQAAAALPVLGRRADGSLVQSRFDWSFHDATIEPAALRITTSPSFRELPLEPSHAIHADALRVHGMRWRLSWPMPVL
jgi:hypothetical protein